MTEKLLSFSFLLFSSIYLWFASELSFGRMGAPKAGFLPIIAGGIAVILSFILVGKQWLQKERNNQGKVIWRKCIFVIMGLVCYIVFLSFVGYLVATFTLMFYLLKVTDTAGWINPLLISASIASGFYLVFEMLLGINLP